jgi:hypothetical protein
MEMRSCLLAGLLLLLPRAGEPDSLREEPSRPKGRHNDSVHRYFPDLDSRLNAVRYGRWRALEIAWTSGINRELDRIFSSYLLAQLADPPRYAPEADRVAPRFLREARPVFLALRWGQTLETQLSDALASPDASAALTEARLQKALDAYRREAYALAEPARPAGGGAEAAALAPVSTRILLSGTALFIQSAQDLAEANFGEQRWRVMETIKEFDLGFAGGFVAGDPATPGALSPRAYQSEAPAVVEAYADVADRLDRLARFRLEVFEALVPGGQTLSARHERDERLRTVARRYGLPAEGIGGR